MILNYMGFLSKLILVLVFIYISLIFFISILQQFRSFPPETVFSHTFIWRNRQYLLALDNVWIWLVGLEVFLNKDRYNFIINIIYPY